MSTQKTEPQVYGHVIHAKGITMDTCDMKLIIKLLDQSMSALNKTAPKDDSRLSEIKKAILQAYIDFNHQRHSLGPNQRFMIDEAEMENALNDFIKYAFAPEDTETIFLPERISKIFKYFKR